MIRWFWSFAATSPADPAGSGRGFGTERDPVRLVFFSDAVFAIAVTLLVLEIRPPEDTRHLLHGLAALWPSYLSYAITFLLIGQVWANHHVMFDHIRSADRMVLFLNTLLLMDIAFLPFAAAVLADAFRTGHGPALPARPGLDRHRDPAGRPAPCARHGRDRRVHPLLLAADPGRDRPREAAARRPRSGVTRDAGGRNVFSRRWHPSAADGGGLHPPKDLRTATRHREHPSRGREDLLFQWQLSPTAEMDQGA
jgi:hypothetical protein